MRRSGATGQRTTTVDPTELETIMHRFLSASAVALILAVPTVGTLGASGNASAAGVRTEALGLPACTGSWGDSMSSSGPP